jgi:DNA-binding protein HU-beta
MKTSEFIEVLAKKADLTLKDSGVVVETFWDLIGATLKKGDEVVFPFGKFVLAKKPAREGRNPFTGETIKIAAKAVPQFKPGKKFKDIYKK